jgi:hypothetical protein
VTGDLQRRGADVEHDRVTLVHERRGGGADPVLGAESLDDDLRERGLRGDAHGAAVHALELSVSLQVPQVAADRHLGDAEGDGELADVGGALPDGLQDLLPSLGGEHGAAAYRGSPMRVRNCPVLNPTFA